MSWWRTRRTCRTTRWLSGADEAVGTLGVVVVAAVAQAHTLRIGFAVVEPCCCGCFAVVQAGLGRRGHRRAGRGRAVGSIDPQCSKPEIFPLYRHLNHLIFPQILPILSTLPKK